jgi:hypothetical protein
MPADLQASISNVPAGAVSFFPSTVKVTSAIFNSSALTSQSKSSDLRSVASES